MPHDGKLTSIFVTNFFVSCPANSPTKTPPTRRPKSSWALPHLIDKGVPLLSVLVSKLDPAKLPVSSFLMVLVADGEIAYRLPDDIIVCPLSAIKP